MGNLETDFLLEELGEIGKETADILCEVAGKGKNGASLTYEDLAKMSPKERREALQVVKNMRKMALTTGI